MLAHVSVAYNTTINESITSFHSEVLPQQLLLPWRVEPVPHHHILFRLIHPVVRKCVCKQYASTSPQIKHKLALHIKRVVAHRNVTSGVSSSPSPSF